MNDEDTIRLYHPNARIYRTDGYWQVDTGKRGRNLTNGPTKESALAAAVAVMRKQQGR